MRKGLEGLAVALLLAALVILALRDPLIARYLPSLPTPVASASDIPAAVAEAARYHCEQFAAAKRATCVSAEVHYGYDRGPGAAHPGRTYSVTTTVETPRGRLVLGWYFHADADGNVQEIE